MPEKTAHPSLPEQIGPAIYPATGRRKEIIWIHWAKAIGIFLVLLGHVDMPHVVMSWIYSFHMPLFFYLSGYLAKSKYTMALGPYVKKHARTLLIPYICLGLVAYCVWFAKNLVHPGGELESIAMWEPLVNMLYGTGYPVLRLVHASSLWFLPSLFSVFVMHWIVKRLCKSDIAYGLVVIGLYYAGYHSFTLLAFRLPMGIESAMIGFLFFAAGNVACRRNITFRPATGFVLGLLSLAAQWGLLYLQKWPIPSVLSGQLWMPTAFIVTAMAGICGLIGIVKAWPGVPAVVTISRNTLAIFTLENAARLALGGVLYILSIRFESNGAKLIYGIVSSVGVLVALSVVADAIRKYCPLILGEKPAPLTHPRNTP